MLCKCPVKCISPPSPEFWDFSTQLFSPFLFLEICPFLNKQLFPWWFRQSHSLTLPQLRSLSYSLTSSADLPAGLDLNWKGGPFCRPCLHLLPSKLPRLFSLPVLWFAFQTLVKCSSSFLQGLVLNYFVKEAKNSQKVPTVPRNQGSGSGEQEKDRSWEWGIRHFK